MVQPLSPVTIQAVHNPNARADAPYGPELLAILNDEGLAAAKAEIETWPDYAPTPLHRLSGLAAAAGLGDIWYKDEGGRFGLGSFKALGGAYAVFCLLASEAAVRSGGTIVSSEDLRSGQARELIADITVCTATDGNHGRSVAWGAQMFGCRCVIYVHATVSEGRKAAMERFGAEVRQIAGNYDDSVRQAAEDAAANGWFVVSDTSYPGYMDIPRDVMDGYAVMAEEVIAQLPRGVLPSHVFVQGGVGGLAAAILACFWRRFGAERPHFVVVEPERAACFYESARVGHPITVQGDLNTMMAGLAAGEVSPLAWKILWAGAESFLTLPDLAASEVMHLLAEGTAGDPPIVAGESAGAGLAGALGALWDSALTKELGLGPESRILVIGSEGATDPALYREIVGRPAEEVMAAE